MIQPLETKTKFKDKLYGRTKEFNQLLDFYDNQELHPNNLVLINGVSGIGKTMFVNCFAEQKMEESAIFVSGKQDLSRDNPPYTSVIQSFTQLIEEWLIECPSKLDEIRTIIEEEAGNNLHILVKTFPRLLHFFEQLEIDEKNLSNNYRDRFNEALMSFTRIISRLNQKVIVFLDDLQWADEGTIGFLKMWLSEGYSDNLFWIGAFRLDDNDSEIWLLAEETILSKHDVSTIKLGGLTPADIREMIADVFEMQEYRLNEYSELILQLTGGNPLFIKESLMYLLEDGVLFYDSNAGLWDYDVSKIKSFDRGSRILEFIIRKMEALPEETVNLLGIGSAIGSHFNIPFLSAVNEQDMSEVELALSQAIDLNMIVEVQPTLGSSTTTHFRFTHDKMQNAAYIMLSEEKKKWIHHAIGRLYESSLGYAAQDRNIYDIVNQFNRCADYFDTPNERLKLVEMNLRAGKKAKYSSAYEQALNYFNNVIHLIETNRNDWKQEIIYEVYFESGEAAFLKKDFVSSVMFYESALKYASSNLEKAKVHFNFLIMYNDVSETDSAVASGQEALKLLDFELLEEVSKFQLYRQFRKIRRKLRKFTPAKLTEMPLNEDPISSQVILVLLELLSPSLNINYRVLVYTTLKNFEVTLNNGISPGSYYGIIGYGTFLGRYFGRIKEGWNWVQAGQAIAKKYDRTISQGKALIIGNSVYGHIVNSFKENHRILEEGFMLSKSTADYLTASYSSLMIIENNLLAGTKLNELKEQSKRYANFLIRIENKEYQCGHDAIVSLSNILGSDELGDLEQKFALITNRYDRMNVNFLNVRWKIMQFYIAIILKRQDIADKLMSDNSLINLAGFSSIQIIRIVSIACYCSNDAHGAKNLSSPLKPLKKLRTEINRLSKIKSDNFLHVTYLLRAIEAEIKNKHEKTVSNYKLAIESAEKQGFTQFAALYHERLHDVYSRIAQSDDAKVELESAIKAYADWGAILKVNELEEFANK